MGHVEIRGKENAAPTRIERVITLGATGEVGGWLLWYPEYRHAFSAALRKGNLRGIRRLDGF